MLSTWEAVEVREFNNSDIDIYIHYWHNPENKFLDDMGLDRNNLPSQKKMREQLVYTLETNKQSCTLLTILFNGKAVGVHELTDLLLQDSAVMHANIWSSDIRGKGVGSISYMKAMAVYFEKYKLKKILFKTPVSNLAANKLKQKLKIEKIGKCKYYLPVFKAPIDAYLYEVNIKDYDNLVSTLSI